MIDYTLKNKKGITLSDDQNEIVTALLKNDYFFNCAQTGLGKTLTTITAAIHKAVEYKDKDFHFVLLLPNSAVKAFVDTLSNILGIKYNIYTATTTRAKLGARFHIFNYSTLSSNLFLNDENNDKVFNTAHTNHYFDKLVELYKTHKNLWLIADEAHMLQDPNTYQYNLMLKIRKAFKGMWFLTATPILNDLDGFFYMVDSLVPGFFHNIYAFRNKYNIFEDVIFWKTRFGKKIKVTKKNPIGFKNLDHLSKRFEEIGIIRSKHYNVNFEYRSAKLSTTMSRYYRAAADGMFSGTIKKTKNGTIVKKHQDAAVARLHDLQRVVSNSHKDLNVIDKNQVSGKELLLINTIKEVLDRGEAVLIYFSYLETLARVKYILETLKTKYDISRILEVSGNITPQRRRAVEEAISPRSVVLITSAGTESVNLQKANNLIFYEIPFPFREFIQAAGRITRMNSEFNSFNIYILEAEGTIDTYKRARILANSAAIKAVLGGSNILPTEVLLLSAEDKQLMKNILLWWK